MLNSALLPGNVFINLIPYFMSSYISKQDLAMAYFPNNSKETASKRFAHEIHSNKPLLAALQATGYSRPRKILSPKQIQIIFSFLGEP